MPDPALRPHPTSVAALKTAANADRTRSSLVAALEALDAVDANAHRADVAALVVSSQLAAWAERLPGAVTALAEHLRDPAAWAEGDGRE